MGDVILMPASTIGSKNCLAGVNPAVRPYLSRAPNAVIWMPPPSLVVSAGLFLAFGDAK
jgi:hypothetical protein